MNLPVIFDIIIGLIFIYLTLSLLTSEIQELITTLLQWRAEHLKKSIEVLFGAGSDRSTTPDEVARVSSLVDQIYNHQLIADLNQEAKGSISEAFRQITRVIGKLYRQITKTRNVFGTNSTGPSFIPASAFALSLIETVNFPSLIQRITEARLERFQDQKLGDIVYIIGNLNLNASLKPLLDKEWQWLSQEFNQIISDFQKKLITLNTALDMMSEKLGFYIQECQVYLPETESTGAEFQRQMTFLKSSLDNPSERTVILARLQPSLNDILSTIRQVNKSKEVVTEILQEKEDSPIYQEIVELNQLLPESLQKSLSRITENAHQKSQSSEEELTRFKQELENWFNQSMDRASGVYRRNSKGIGITIGVIIAIITNADTVLIINTFAKDSTLRESVKKYADTLVEKQITITPGNYEPIQKEVNQALNNLVLPLGWNPKNVEEQESLDKDSIPYLKRIIGWLISGVALSMGGSFWFDLLGKIMIVRNAGKIPEAPPKDSSST
jgi:hypothetical protein